jgi:hypothetical protein
MNCVIQSTKNMQKYYQLLDFEVLLNGIPDDSIGT